MFGRGTLCLPDGKVTRGHLNSLKDGRDAKGGVTIDYFQYLVVAKASDAMEGFNII